MAENRILHYAVAVLSVAIALGLRQLSLFASGATFLPFAVAVFASAWLGGLRPGLLATGLGAAGGVFVEMAGPATEPAIVLDAVLFIAFGLCLSLICDRVRAMRLGLQSAITQNEERFERLVSAASSIIWVADANGYFTQAQVSWGRYTGQDELQQLGQGWLQAVHADDRGRLHTLLREAGVASERSLVDVRVWHKASRTYRTLEMRCLPVRDAAGRLREWVGKCIDIEERKQAEYAQSRLAAIVTSSQDAIVSKSLDGVIISWNAAAERLFGYTASEAIGHNVSMIIPQERMEEERRIIETIKRGDGFGPFETVRLAKDGRLLDVSLAVSPVRDSAGTIIGAAKVARDISDRRVAEHRLRVLMQVSERLSTTLDVDRLLELLVREAMGLLDAGGGCAGLRRPEGMVSGKCYRGDEEVALDYTWPPGHGLAGWVLEQGKPYLTNDAPQDGQAVLDLVRRLGIRNALCAPLAGADGQVLGFLELHNKRGGFVNADADLLAAVCRVASSALQNALTHGRVVDAEEALRTSDRRKDEFLAVLAHELRNPLAPIGNSIEILRMAGVDGATSRGVVDMMERQVQHLVRLVDDLMEVSRISRGAMQLKKEPVVLNTAIHGAVEISKPILEANGHRVEFDLPEYPLLVNGDRTRLTQIIANLVNNAAKYTPPRGRIQITLARGDTHAVLTVKDNGIGIPPEMLTQVFEMFTQVDRSLERKTGGLGIGLSLVRRLVELHGGTVEARSAGQGRGSEFVVRLPLAVDLLHASPFSAPEPARPQAVARRVLVVDDNRDAANSLAMLLRTLGHEVHVAYDGMEALEIGASAKPDLVLLDLGMPRLNGYDAAKRIRETPWGTNAVLVALTGWGQEQDRKRSRESGFDRHLVKPVDFAVLQDLLLASEEPRVH